MAVTYKDAGVDVSAGDALVDWLVENETSTPHKDKIVSGIGGFAALFRANFQNMQRPLLVSSTDGVGTKVKLAAEFGRYRGVGQDLVAMCVNDLICVGAQPLFFLDYYATGKLDLPTAKEFLAGVRAACAASDCALIGGETAEMPGIYRDNDFDCAGFSVGVVDEPKTLGAHLVQPGDVLLGVESSGFHSNGYSLLRQVFARDMKDWVEILLRPTHLYPRLVLDLLARQKGLHAIAHVTGGGMDNLLRVIPDGTALKLKAWTVPPMFMEVKKRSALEWPELLRTLNCGVGLVLYVTPLEASAMMTAVKATGMNCQVIGEVVRADQKIWDLDFNTLKGG